MNELIDTGKKMRKLQIQFFEIKAKAKGLKGKERFQAFNEAREILKEVKPLEKQFDELLADQDDGWFSIDDKETRVPNEGKIEVKFDDGRIQDFDDPNLHWAMITHWRFKKNETDLNTTKS